MATMNPFDLLVDDDPNQIMEATSKVEKPKKAAPAPAKFPTKPLAHAQAGLEKHKIKVAADKNDKAKKVVSMAMVLYITHEMTMAMQTTSYGPKAPVIADVRQFSSLCGK